MPSYAFLDEAWNEQQHGVKSSASSSSSNRRTRAKTPATYDMEGRYNDQYTFTACKPGLTKQFRPTIIEEARGNVYDVANDDRAGCGSQSFMDYDDFYRSDFQYTSDVVDADDAATDGRRLRRRDMSHDNHRRLHLVTTETTGSPAREEEEEHCVRQEYLGDRSSSSSSLLPGREYFSQHPPQQRQYPVVSEQQMTYELVLYTISGIFLILILEQFLQLGTKLSA